LASKRQDKVSDLCSGAKDLYNQSMENGQKTLVFVGAHPDDESFGVGGTLVKYAAAGVNVYYICGTRGEVGEVTPSIMRGFATIGDLRWHELECAAKEIGLKEIIYLGYRDSGMAGSPDNQHPQALAAAPVEEVAGRIVRELRRLKPEVVLTFDPIGGYRHPDHIAIHNATVMAYNAAGESGRYADAGPVYRPRKLYFHVFPRGWMKWWTRILKILGHDPRHFGRNKDIDLTESLGVEYPIHAVIRLDKATIRTRNKAVKCHASQLGKGSFWQGLLGFFGRFFTQKDSFSRIYPPVNEMVIENDLFEGTEDKK
jgi:N-acetyl-1-D-myo-inositol-2-amino-2-deoxy-alpha-D-glucopyranoside deacetylase